MAFAEIMKEHLLLVNENYMLGIIELFNDCDETKPFSILNVARVAQKIYGLMPGDWYNPSQISYVLAALHHNRLESLQSLTFVIFNSGNLFYDEIAKKMLGNGASPCTCSNKTKGLLVCGNCHKAHRSVAVIALARIGLDYSE